MWTGSGPYPPSEEVLQEVSVTDGLVFDRLINSGKRGGASLIPNQVNLAEMQNGEKKMDSIL